MSALSRKQRHEMENKIASLVRKKLEIVNRISSLKAVEPAGSERNIKEFALLIKFERLSLKINKLFQELEESGVEAGRLHDFIRGPCSTSLN